MSIIPEDEMQQIYADNQLIIDALKPFGIEINSIYDFVNGQDAPPAVLDTLIGLLLKVKDHRVLEGLIRALSIRAAKGKANTALIELFKRNVFPDRSINWTIGNAFSIIVEEDDFEYISKLLKNKKYGRGRQMLAYAIAKTKNPKAANILMSMLDDEDVAGHAVWGLRVLKDPKARKAVEPFLHHEQTWIRNEAKKALAAFDKVEAKTKEKE